jgi:hypothetical protein
MWIGMWLAKSKTVHPQNPGIYALLALALALSGCGGELGLWGSASPVALSHSQGEIHNLRPGESLNLSVEFVKGTEPVTVRLALADPCAKGTANCPGWDSSRYPHVTHSGGPYTLSEVGERGTFTFSVSPDAIPQGVYKYEVVVEQGSKSWIHPFYLRIPPEGTSAIEAINMWRSLADLPPVREDPEWAFKAWLHGRYRGYNYYSSPPPHDEDLDQPFATPLGKEAAQRGLEASGTPFNNDEVSISIWMFAPFHRQGIIGPGIETASLGTYREVIRRGITTDGYSMYTLPKTLLQSGPLPGEKLFPPPNKTLPFTYFVGAENPDPITVCIKPELAPKRPFFSQEGLEWGVYGSPSSYVSPFSPRGFPIMVYTYRGGVDTEVLRARLVRLSDGKENPVCAYGSSQYWEEREYWRDAGKGLLSWGSLIAIPHQALTPGEEYEVYIEALMGEERREWNWRFRVAPFSELRPGPLPPSWVPR